MNKKKVNLPGNLSLMPEAFDEICKKEPKDSFSGYRCNDEAEAYEIFRSILYCPAVNHLETTFFGKTILAAIPKLVEKLKNNNLDDLIERLLEQSQQSNCFKPLLVEAVSKKWSN